MSNSATSFFDWFELSAWTGGKGMKRKGRSSPSPLITEDEGPKRARPTITANYNSALLSGPSEPITWLNLVSRQNASHRRSSMNQLAVNPFIF